CPFREPLVPAAPSGSIGERESGGAGDSSTPPPLSDTPALPLSVTPAPPLPRSPGRPYLSFAEGTRAPNPGQLAGVAEALVGAPCGLIVCGPPDVPGLA